MMKYSIQGSLYTSDGASILNILNQRALSKLDYTLHFDQELGRDIFNFNAWINLPADKDTLYSAMKNYMDSKGVFGRVQWHPCKHDENSSTPCVVTDFYERLVT